MSTQKAVCIGINKFTNLPSATLAGCVNDANDMALFLQETRGFAESDIIILTDAAATKKAVMSALNGFVELATAGILDNLVFSFSSHGTQVPDLNGDEQPETMGELAGTRVDEAFCTTDLIRKGDVWDPDHLITDDELHDLFSALPLTCQLEVFLDTCHSGTGLKDMDELLTAGAPRARFLAPPSYDAIRTLSAPVTISTTTLPTIGVSNTTKPFSSAASTAILWAGCRSDQTSADATFGDRPSGAFTYFYLKNARAHPSATRGHLLDLIRADLKSANYAQLPQLELAATIR